MPTTGEKLWIVLVGDFQQELKLFGNPKGHRNQCKVESIEVNVKLLKNCFAIHTSLKGMRFFTIQRMLFFITHQRKSSGQRLMNKNKILTAAFVGYL